MTCSWSRLVVSMSVMDANMRDIAATKAENAASHAGYGVWVAPIGK